MTLRDFTAKAAAICLCGLFLTPAWAQDALGANSKPNIVFIMADDLGYGDAHCYNPESKIPTPNIDRLAREGMRFTDAHSPGSTCVPTRYGLLTGRYPFRMPSKGKNEPKIDPERVTIASLLRANGYETGMVGKWHLGIGGADPDYSRPLRGGPVDRGFDYYFGIPASLDIPPYYYIENDRCVEPPTETIEESHSEGVTRIQGAFWRDGLIAPGFKHEEVLPTFTQKAVEFIDRRAESDQRAPFFLYLALPAPHTPWLPVAPHLGKSQAGDYGDFTAQVDDTVGQVLKALDRHGLSDDTLVFFTSDNGPVWYSQDVEKYGHASVGPLRGMKGDAFEGGHRMPFIARWPGKIQSGSISGEVICHTDMLATFAAVCGVSLPPEAGHDSYSILPALMGEEYERPIREATLTLYSGKSMTVRQGPWKLIRMLGSGGFSQPKRIEPEEGGPLGQLYNLEQDISESDNLWSERQDIVKRLEGLLEKYKAQERSVPEK